MQGAGARHRRCRGTHRAHAQQRPPHAADAHPRRLRGRDPIDGSFPGHPEDVRHGCAPAGPARRAQDRAAAHGHLAREAADHPPVHPGRPGRHLHRQDRQRAADPRLLDGGRARAGTAPWPPAKTLLAAQSPLHLDAMPARLRRFTAATITDRGCCWPSSPRPVAWATPSTAASGATASAAWRRRCSTASERPVAAGHLRAAGPVDPNAHEDAGSARHRGGGPAFQVHGLQGLLRGVGLTPRAPTEDLQMTKPPATGRRTRDRVCNVAAGPFCGMLLADMRADVVRSSTRGRRHAARPADQRRLQRELRLAEPQQALGHAQPQGRGRPRPAARAGRRRRRADREQPARRDGAPGRRLRGAVRAQPEAGVLHLRLRPGGPRSRKAASTSPYRP